MLVKSTTQSVSSDVVNVNDGPQIKIDQDIVHGWTNTLCDKYEAKGRTKVTYDFISKELNKYCSKFSWTKHKNIFQQLNLLRVIQYAKDDKIIKYLLKELSKYH